MARAHPLFAALRERGKTVQECAMGCDVSIATVYAWDAGIRCPSDKHAEMLAKIIGRESVRSLVALTVAGLGSGRLPAIRRAATVTLRELVKRGENDLAQRVQVALEMPA